MRSRLLTLPTIWPVGPARCSRPRDSSWSILATEAVRLASNIRPVTIAPLMAEAMRRISEES